MRFILVYYFSGVILILYGFAVFTTERFVLSLALLIILVFFFLFFFFSVLLSIVTTSVWEERVGLCAFHAFVCLFCTC